ncbi:MAG TPA: hypothetical protein VLE95_06640 [Chlamydiales bacterium]|nr:hypothetical protein [Chlamydiales bacterium]
MLKRVGATTMPLTGRLASNLSSASFADPVKCPHAIRRISRYATALTTPESYPGFHQYMKGGFGYEFRQECLEPIIEGKYKICSFCKEQLFSDSVDQRIKDEATGILGKKEP